MDRAYKYQRMVIDTLEIIHNKEQEHPDFPVAYSLYSFILRDMGRIDEAIDYQERATKIREKINRNDPKLAINYNNLGIFNLQGNKLEEAEKWQRKAIKTDLKYRNKNHPDVAVDFFNYAKILDALGKFSQVIKCLRISRRIEVKNASDNNASNKNIEEIDEMIFVIKQKHEL